MALADSSKKKSLDPHNKEREDKKGRERQREKKREAEGTTDRNVIYQLKE